MFAVVGLLTDFFLQLVFFATFLSVDIRRMEVSVFFLLLFLLLIFSFIRSISTKNVLKTYFVNQIRIIPQHFLFQLHVYLIFVDHWLTKKLYSWGDKFKRQSNRQRKWSKLEEPSTQVDFFFFFSHYNIINYKSDKCSITK